MVVIKVRLLICTVLALALVGSAGSGAARAATVSASGGVITIAYTSTDATAESVTVNTFGTDWRILGVTGAPVDIPISGNCDIQVTAAGGTNQSLTFSPAWTIDAATCGAAPRFSLDTTGVDHLYLSGVINMTSGTNNRLIATAPAQVVADFTATLDSGTIDFQSTLGGSHAVELTAASIDLEGSTGTVPSALTSLDATATTVTLGGDVTTSGRQLYVGSVRISSSVTLSATMLTLGNQYAHTVTNTAGSTSTLTANVTDTSVIYGSIGKVGGSATEKDIALVKAGTGSLRVVGPNTYTGTTTVSAGTLTSDNANGLGAATAGTTVANGATLAFRLAANNAEPITLAGGSTLAASTAFAENLGGAITLQNGSQTFDVDTGATLNLTGGVDGQTAGRGAVTATGAGRVAIQTAGMGATNAVASFASSASGTLRIGGDITATGAVTLAGAVETYAAAVTVTGAPVAGSGTIDNGNGSSFSTLTLDTGSESNTLSGAIGSGAGDASKLNLVLSGTGTHTLSATSGFTGSLTVQAGGLVVSGTLTHPSATTIASGATLAGSGTAAIGSPVTFSSGSPGFGIGAGYPFSLTLGSIASAPTTGYLNVVVDGTTPGTGYTQIASTGSANLAGLDVWSDGFEAPLGTVITPVTTASGFTGTLRDHPEGSYYGYWQISYLANGGKDMTWTYVGEPPAPTAVSPATSSTAGGGLLTVTGAPLYDGTQVTVGGAPCTHPTVVSISELTCTLPAHAAGVVDVVVTNVNRSATLANAVTYAAPPAAATTAASSAPAPRALAIGTPRVVGTKLITAITAPGAGAITQTAVTKKGRKTTTRCRVRRAVTTAGDLTITCALNARTRAALRRSKLRITVKTTFTPTGGVATSRVAKVTVKRATTGKRALPL